MKIPMNGMIDLTELPIGIYIIKTESESIKLVKY
jgi:hypothetical protein